MSKLKDFVRLDDSNQFVLGSNVRRKTKPSKGRWTRIYSPQCCSVSAPIGDPEDNTITSITVKCGGQTLGIYTVDSVVPADIVTNLNTNYSLVGEFSVNGTNFEFSSELCQNPTITVAYSGAPEPENP